MGNPISYALRAGKAAKRVASDLIEGGFDIPGFHWSHNANMVQTEPRMYGKGIKGKEGERLQGADDIRPRTYFYTNDKLKEPGLGPNHYSATLRGVYPQGDPLKLMLEARAKNPKDELTEFERLVKSRGFKGYEGNDAVVYYDPVKVGRHQTGTHVGTPTQGAPSIVDTTEVMPGTRTGHLPGIENVPEHEEKLMKWLSGTNKIYDKLGHPAKAIETRGYYPNPDTGVVERNRLLATSVPDAPGAEEAVDTVGTIRNILLAQNARGYSGVGREGAENAVRVNMAGQTPEQIEQVIQGAKARGYEAFPHGEGVNVMFGPEGDDLVKATHGMLEDANVPAASGYTGNARSGYNEYDWSQPGEGKLTREEIIPRLLRNPELMQQIDRTGMLQTLSKGVSAADSDAALRYGLPLREDVQSLRNTIGTGGLRGLLDRVQTQGYKGLPAVAGMKVYSDEEDK